VGIGTICRSARGPTKDRRIAGVGAKKQRQSQEMEGGRGGGGAAITPAESRRRAEKGRDTDGEAPYGAVATSGEGNGSQDRAQEEKNATEKQMTEKIIGKGEAR
jgi:hypothetical protein